MPSFIDLTAYPEVVARPIVPEVVFRKYFLVGHKNSPPANRQRLLRLLQKHIRARREG